MSSRGRISISYEARASIVIPLAAGTGLPSHSHPQHQLAWAPSGLLTLEVGGFRWVLQRSRALWIPGGVEHAVLPGSSSSMLSVYFEPGDCPHGWDSPTVLDASGLVGPLLSHLADLGDAPDATNRRARATAVLWDLMRPVPVTTLAVILPTDPLALRIALALRQDPADSRDLEDWGREVGASPRTLSRRFRAETGVSFASWRTLQRLDAALPLLGTGQPVARVARAVGYRTASAFIAAFRREIGTTPAAYFAASSAESGVTPR
ncbi:helix-turn-helix domain-containing protein [Streptomyces sp. SID8366]|uniref:helix-turn-helix domain-containing protein n=1 Tax=unclassified Streptomyces TaxID=2593676 RepID=UPI000DBA6F3C|nr:helix-turn-helix transcriptional regulator [Streptomyces sp. PsTaAH-130]MYU06865.1 helix-turn-helix domain-containing protein [Streptomyces sp. SID8366]MYU64715.1 helix-turn-helix domain-containing protein [Streptomyces sp. SID69]